MLKSIIIFFVVFLASSFEISRAETPVDRWKLQKNLCINKTFNRVDASKIGLEGVWLYDHNISKNTVEVCQMARRTKDSKELQRAHAIALVMTGSIERARDLISRYAPQDNERLWCIAGWIYMWGPGVERNFSEASKFYRRASEAGEGCGPTGLGWIAFERRKESKNPTEYIELTNLMKDQWLMALEKGDTRVYRTLGVLILQEKLPGSKKEAVQYLKRVLEYEHRQVQYWLGIAYAQGKGVPKNIRKSLDLFEAAAAQGMAWADYQSGYYRWVNNTHGGHAEAVKYFRKAAEQDVAPAQAFLGYAYLQGKGVDKSYSRAEQWLQRGAENGSSWANYLMGYNKWVGNFDGGKNDAVKYFRVAAEENDDDAQYYLGVAYLYGEGVRKDRDKALILFRKAAQNGNEEAKQKVARIELAESGGQDKHWDFVEERDIMTDELEYYVVGRPVSHQGADEAPIFVVVCRNDKATLQIEWNVPLQLFDEQMVIVTARFDRTDPISLIMATNESRTITGELNDMAKLGMELGRGFMKKLLPGLDPRLENATAGWKSAQIINIMRRADRMIIRATSFKGKEITAIFNTENFEKYISALPDRCN
jgi:hypothetical protein